MVGHKGYHRAVLAPTAQRDNGFTLVLLHGHPYAIGLILWE
jgi:hypothetical protein